MNPKQLGATGVVVLVAVVLGWVATKYIRDDDAMQDSNALSRGMGLPVAWLYYNNSEVNSRNWTDFQARSSRVINVPFLNLCYEAAVKHLGQSYRVEVIGGLADLAVRLGGWDKMPVPLQNPDAVVNEPEMNWIRSVVLAKWGGLWVSPSTVWLKNMDVPQKEESDPKKKKVIFFGMDSDVTFTGPGGTGVPGLRVVWSPIPEHPVWIAWESRARERLDRRSGGSEFRHDEKSDTADALRDFGDSVMVLPLVELGRKGAAGRRIQLEDLLAAGQEGVLPFEVTTESRYAFIPWNEIKRRSAFGWFLRMSEEQILSSDLAISWLFKMALNV